MGEIIHCPKCTGDLRVMHFAETVFICNICDIALVLKKSIKYTKAHRYANKEQGKLLRGFKKKGEE